MRIRNLSTSLVLAGAMGPAAAQALACETLREPIDAKIRAAGGERFTLTIVERAASAPGRSVGSCERGSRRIVYVQGTRGSDAILTECKDGSVSVGGNCGR